MKKLLLTLMAATSMGVSAQNPYLPLWEHVPDGEPRVFEDPDNPGKYRAYIIGSHDTSYDRYCGLDIRMWSAPVEDLSQWRNEGPIFSYHVNNQWDIMYAPDLVEVKDKTTGKKTYYLYPHSRGWGRTAMVCKGDRPNGPFTPVNITADGTRCVDGSRIDFDPSVFVENITDTKDPDYAKGFRAYVFYGFQHSTAYELDQNNMYAVRPSTEIHDYFIPASHRYGVVRDPEGTKYPALYKGQNPGEFNFFEASSIRQVGNKYVMVFSGYSGPDYGLGSTNSALRYAYGDTPLGPWRSGGVLVDSRGVVPNEDGTHLEGTNWAHNTHGSLQEINGQWYVFYHRPPRGFGNARQAMVAPVKIEWDNKKVSDGGQVRITGYDPYTKGNVWTAKASDGTEYRGAEVTSEGFQIFGLNPYGYYSAGIACHMSNGQWMQDNHDVWNDNMILKGIEKGGVIGYKYFGFGGLAKDTKGIKGFTGTKKGDGTTIQMFLTPRTEESFTIKVMLDGYTDNKVWNGKQIATLTIPANSKDKAIMVSEAVPAVEGLKGKHAIYFVSEGGKFDMEGMGFGRKGAPCVKPNVPSITITVDDQQLDIPSTPVYTTQSNGYMDCNHYQVYAKMNGGSGIKVTSSDPSVTYTIDREGNDKATVTATYNGQQKFFHIGKSMIVESGGTGMNKAVMTEVDELPAHTIFMPQDLSKFNERNPLPILVWGNGACTNSPWEHYKFLNEIASQGYLVVATGYLPEKEEPYKGDMSTPQQQIESIDWAIAQNTNPKSPLCGKINTKAVCAAGMSCGGLQTLFNCADPRISTYMICNSGLFIDPSIAMPNMPMPGKDQLKSIHAPIIYILGGETDIAYKNGMDDFHRIKDVPAFAANFPVGHGGTYRQPHGGEFRFPAIAWLNWQLKGDKRSAAMFQGTECGLSKRKGWTVEKNDLIDK